MPANSAQQPKQFSVTFFLAVNTLSLGGILFLVAIFAPSVWQAQISSPVWLILAVFLLMHLANCFGEFFFHRYVLHARVIPFLGSMWRQHTIHHAFTRICSHEVPEKRRVKVENRYPIISDDQHVASFFPWYSLLGLSLFASFVLIPLQIVLAKTPILLGGYCAIAWSLLLYEIIHAVEHKPLSFWQPLLGHKIFGRFWQKLYSFHQRHHADILCNEGISGFFGFPLADLLIGTLAMPKDLYPDKKVVGREEFDSPRPCRFVRWLDRFVERVHKDS